MTPHELARILLDGPDLPVHHVYDCGDYWHTILAPEVTSADLGTVCHSPYHDADKVTGRDEDGQRQVLLLS
jgi:hypothetical protein